MPVICGVSALSVSSYPTRLGAFDDPSLGLDLKSIAGFLYDIDATIERFLDKGNGRAAIAIALIGEKSLNGWVTGDGSPRISISEPTQPKR